MKRQATAQDFKYGTYLYDSSNNEFIVKDLYDSEHGIYTTNKGRVLYSSEAHRYTTKDKK